MAEWNKTQEKLLRFSGYLLAIKIAFEEKLNDAGEHGPDEIKTIMRLYSETIGETLAKFMDGKVGR